MGLIMISFLFFFFLGSTVRIHVEASLWPGRVRLLYLGFIRLLPTAVLLLHVTREWILGQCFHDSFDGIFGAIFSPVG